MQIKNWIERRKVPGTLADVARRVLDADEKYRDVEKTLLSMYVLEALIRHGDQRRAAEAIGVSCGTVKRVLRAMKLSAVDVRRVARQLRETQSATA